MKRVLAFIKRFWVAIFTVVAAILYFVNLLIGPHVTKTLPTPTPNLRVASYQSIVPGVGTEEDLTRLLGTPFSKSITSGQTSLEYNSTNVYRHHTAVTKGGKVAIFKEIVNSNDQKGADSITNVYGNPTNTLYSKLSNSSFNLYIYPQNGIAYLGHPDGTLLEIWYFEPTSIDGFISAWGQDYSTKPAPKESAY